MASRYWVGGAGTWNLIDTTNWAATSGGTGGETPPTSSDDVFFDGNSFSGDATVTLGPTNLLSRCNNLDLTGVNHQVMFDLNTLPGTSLEISGNVIGNSYVYITNSGSGIAQVILNGATAKTLTSNGMSFGNLTLATFTGGLTLLDDLFMDSGAGVDIQGDFDANNFDVTTEGVFANGTLTISMGSGTWHFKPTTVATAIFTVNNSNVSIDAGTSLMDVKLTDFPGTITGISTGVKSFTFYDLIVDGHFDATKTFYFDCSDVNFNDVSFVNSPFTVQWASLRTHTLGSLDANGYNGGPLTFIADVPGSQAKISSLNVSVSFVNVSDNKALGAIPFDDTTGGVDEGNNTNWLFAYSNLFLQNVFLVGADTAGDVQLMNVGKSDDGTPIYFELETQDIEFGDRGHLKKISDQVAVFSQFGMDSQIQVRANDGEYKKIEMSLDSRVNIGEDINVEGNFFTFKWFGVVNEASPVLEGFLLENITDLGLTKP